MQLSVATFGEQFWGPIVGSNLRTVAFKNDSFGEQLWKATLGKCFRQQLLGEALAALGSSYSELLSEKKIGEQLWGISLLNNFGEQLWEAGVAWRSSFARQLQTKVLKTAALGTSFRTQVWGAAFASNFAEQLSGAALENGFGEPLWGIALKYSRFGTIISQRYFGE